MCRMFGGSWHIYLHTPLEREAGGRGVLPVAPPFDYGALTPTRKDDP